MEIRVTYVVNGTVKHDILTGSSASVQRSGMSVCINFPDGDGRFVQRFTRTWTKPSKVGFVDYEQCSVVSKEEIED